VHAPERGQGFSLAGRVAVVTGAAGLLGRQHCRALADAGATVVATDLDGAGCEAVARDINAASQGRAAATGADRPRGSALAVAADITVPESLSRLRDAVLAHADRIDVLINNAALNDRFTDDDGGSGDALSRFEDYPLARWRRSLDVNVTGTFLACQILGGEMARRRAGSIINVASTYGMVGPDQRIYRRPDGSQAFWKSGVYPASKGAVLAFTRFLAAYWADRGVRVNSLSPGGVAQPGQEPYFVEQYAQRTPLGRMADPHELGGAVVFLASDASSYVTGTNLVVDGGWTAW
jgi:NAD(P)-dependent dehydrogenase (short-subunit alcohol dehydrogenase family)